MEDDIAELTRLVKRLTKEGKDFASIATPIPDGPPQVSAVFLAQCARNGNELFGLIQTEITLLLILQRNKLSNHRIAPTVVNAENPTGYDPRPRCRNYTR